MANSSSWKAITNHIIGVFNPLKYAFSDYITFKDFMSGFGWDVASLPTAYQRIANDISDLASKSGIILNSAERKRISLSDVASILQDVKDIYDQIQNINIAPNEVLGNVKVVVETH